MSKFHLIKNHDYYIKVQWQFLVTGAPWCNFVVYTTKDMFIERILPDIPFMTCMLLKLSLLQILCCLFYAKEITLNYLLEHLNFVDIHWCYP